MMRLALLLAFTGCVMNHSPSGECNNVGCTDEFRAITVHVTDAAGNPVSGLHPTWAIDGASITVDPSGATFQPGDYVVITDAERRLIVGTADVTFSVSSAQGSATGHFEISTGECQCHVSSVSGPGTLVLR